MSDFEVITRTLSDGMFNAIVAIVDEVEYAKEKWEGHPGRHGQDADKPVEHWILHARNYLDSAAKKCYNVDKTAALEDLRKAAGLLLRCFENLGCPPREVNHQQLLDLLQNGSISWEEYTKRYNGMSKRQR